ncbi:MAG TPA: PqqD family protein [Candidatus Acidoferrales bacterium]
MPLSFSARVSSLPEVMYRTVGEEAVLLNIKKQTYFGLDSIGARMWTVLNESATIQAALETLLAEYDVSESQLRKDLEVFVEKLIEQGLVEAHPAG